MEHPPTVMDRRRRDSPARHVARLGAIFLLVTMVSPAGSAVPGAQLWVKTYNGPANLYDAPNALAVSTDGTKVFATGYSRGATSLDDYATVAYEASTGRALGDPLQRPGEPATSRRARVSPDGSSVFVTGTSWTTNRIDYATMAYDASTGDELWIKRYSTTRTPKPGRSQ